MFEKVIPQSTETKSEKWVGGIKGPEKFFSPFPLEMSAKHTYAHAHGKKKKRLMVKQQEVENGQCESVKCVNFIHKARVES